MGLPNLEKGRTELTWHTNPLFVIKYLDLTKLTSGWDDLTSRKGEQSALIVIKYLDLTKLTSGWDYLTSRKGEQNYTVACWTWPMGYRWSMSVYIYIKGWPKPDTQIHSLL